MRASPAGRGDDWCPSQAREGPVREGEASHHGLKMPSSGDHASRHAEKPQIFGHGGTDGRAVPIVISGLDLVASSWGVRLWVLESSVRFHACLPSTFAGISRLEDCPSC